MKAETVAIIGLDRISGSAGLKIKSTDLGLSVLGHDRDRQTMRQAKELGMVDATESNLGRAAAKADILISNVSLAEQPEVLQVIGESVQQHAIIIDISRLKGPGVDMAERFLGQGHYIGVYPVLAAAHLSDARSDIGSAREDLFQNSLLCIMTPLATDPKAVETVVNLGSVLGATPFFIDPQEYDNLAHGIETLPGLLGAAVYKSVAGATGWRDVLRFAGLPFYQITSGLDNPDLARMAIQDREVTLRWLDDVINELHQVRKWVADGEEERLELILGSLNQERNKWLRDRAKNDWTEIDDMPDVHALSLGSRLFGSRRSRKKE